MKKNFITNNPQLFLNMKIQFIFYHLYIIILIYYIK
jgi:hypothetical protein